MDDRLIEQIDSLAAQVVEAYVEHGLSGSFLDALYRDLERVTVFARDPASVDRAISLARSLAQWESADHPEMSELAALVPVVEQLA